MSLVALRVEGGNLPAVWEESVVACWEKGLPFRTQYDRPGDPPSKDCTMLMIVQDPLSEPRIHRSLPTGLEELEIYRQEVVLGIHDHYVRPGGWSYSYHDRLFNYPGPNGPIDQVALMVEQLVKAPHTRRAQAITWIPEIDADSEEPPCLQRIWGRIAEEDGGPHFMMATEWRSRDAWKAAFMNMWALIDLQRSIAERLAERLGKVMKVGPYLDFSNSYHIYGSYFAGFEGFLKMMEQRSFVERTWKTDFAEPFFEEARRKLLEEKER